MSIEGKVDMSDVMSGMDVLSMEIKTHLARSMAVAGGKVLRDEAKLRVAVKSGRLRDSIYLAYREKESVGPKVVYSVTWNSRNAPHGHLVEFGTYVAAAHPFLRPAMDSAGQRALDAMRQRGRERLPELLAGKAGPDDEP